MNRVEKVMKCSEDHIEKKNHPFSITPPCGEYKVTSTRWKVISEKIFKKEPSFDLEEYFLLTRWIP